MNIRMRISAADRAMSDWIRTRAGWKCEVCGLPFPERSPDLQHSHFIKRGGPTEVVRHHEDNGVAACPDCHRKLENRPAAQAALAIKTIGAAKWENLKHLSKMTVKRSERDLTAIAADYRSRSAALGFYRGRGPALSTFVPGRVA